MWLDGIRYFAQGLDFVGNGQPRRIETITSNPAALLDSNLIHDLPAEQAEHYIQCIAQMVFSPELLTSIGIRCRATRHWELLDYIDYHGPNTVWPKESFDIAKGLRRAGLHHLAAELDRRLADGLAQAGEFSEFFYVSRNGKVWYDRDEALMHFDAESPDHAVPTPERGQAWTIAAAIRIAHDAALRDRETAAPPTDLERSLLAGMN
jgi:glycogen debranching enzyme